MADVMIYIVAALAVVSVILSLYVIKTVKAGKDDAKLGELEKQISALSLYLQQTSGNNSKEFESNRREMTESLNFMTKKLEDMTVQNYETLMKLKEKIS